MSAAVLQFPEKVQRQARRRTNRVELDARHAWMMQNRDKWQTQATDGRTYVEPMVYRLMEALQKKLPDKYPPLTMKRMRSDIAEGRKLIEKRNQVKAWLVSLGADPDNIKDAEQALFFAFDKLA